jgi:hypothetical protein
MISSYDDFDTAESNNSAANSENQVDVGNYYQTVVKKTTGLPENRYIFMNDLMENFNLNYQEIQPVFKYTPFYQTLLSRYMRKNYIDINYIDTYVDTNSLNVQTKIDENYILVIENIQSGTLQITEYLSNVNRGIVFVIGNIYHTTILIFDLDTSTFYSIGFGYDVTNNVDKNIGALYTVDHVLPDTYQSAGIIWVQELTPKIKHNIQEELSKIDKIYYKFDKIEQNKYDITNNNILIGRRLMKYLDAELIYKNLEIRGIRHDTANVSNCLRWAFKLVDQTDVLYNERLCKDTKHSASCRVLRNRLWDKLKDSMLLYINTDEAYEDRPEYKNFLQDDIYKNSILTSIKEINNRLKRKRKRTGPSRKNVKKSNRGFRSLSNKRRSTIRKQRHSR